MTLCNHGALITGAGQGIGRACAEVFASKGADLVLLDRKAETLEDVVQTTERLGAKVIPMVLDLTETERLPEALEKARGGMLVDILVNNAGFDRPGSLSKIDRQDFESVTEIHLTVPLLLMQCLLPAMRSAGWGRIINVSSIYGLIGAKGEIAYSTVKAGLIGLTKSVAKETGRDGVTVNTVLPGLTRTPTIEKFMAARYKEAIIRDTPLGRMAEPEEIAHVIAFLASEEASFITAAVIPVSGGWGI
jgi:NAD(P)-dependent dehydrogenase (short-subunit alcohol dehydrogenase family)